VKADIKAAFGERGRIQRRSIKRILAEDVVPRMTIDRLKSRKALDEIVEWYKKIGRML
jgi:hypothetical protein